MDWISGLLPTVVTAVGTGGVITALTTWRNSKQAEERLRNIEDAKNFGLLVNLAYGWGEVHLGQFEENTPQGKKVETRTLTAPVALGAQLAALHSAASIAVRNPLFRLAALAALHNIAIVFSDPKRPPVAKAVADEATKIHAALQTFFARGH